MTHQLNMPKKSEQKAALAVIEQVEDKIVTLKLRAAALARRDANLPLILSGTVFRPALVNDVRKLTGEHAPGLTPRADCSTR